MQEIWFSKAKTKEERTKVKQDIALAEVAFGRLEKILSAKIRDGTSLDNYGVANWPYLMADLNGYNRALTEVLKLIKGT
jgi:hypothetical protein